MQDSILDYHQQQFPHLIEQIDQLRVFYQERLWKQLSDVLLQYVKDQKLQSGTNLKDLYEGFVKNFYHEIDEFKLVRFLIKTADQYGDMQNRIDFLSRFEFFEKQAKLMIQLKSAYYVLQQNKLEEVQSLLKTFKQQIERLQDVEPLLYSLLYSLAFNFYRVKKNYEEFYINALQYLAYTPDTDMDNEEKVALSLEMAFAILISPQIYNYSELLSQKVLLSLKQSTHAWVYSLLETFNKGDVPRFQQQIKEYQGQISEQQLLAQNINILQEKIRIMAFLELAFSLPKNNRQCTFGDISQVTYVDQDQVEQLVMRTISKGLIRGKINQIDQTVSIAYIVPRVLTNDKIEVMLRKFDNWEATLCSLLKDVDQKSLTLK